MFRPTAIIAKMAITAIVSIVGNAEDRNLEEEALVARLLDEERVRDREREHGRRQGPPPPVAGHDVQRVDDRQKDHRRRVGRPERQHQEDHDRGDHERRERSL